MGILPMRSAAQKIFHEGAKARRREGKKVRISLPPIFPDSLRAFVPWRLRDEFIECGRSSRVMLFFQENLLHHTS